MGLSDLITATMCVLTLAGCGSDSSSVAMQEGTIEFEIIEPAGAIEPLFINSIVSTEIDFITNTDPGAVAELTYEGRDRREMPDKRSDVLFDEQAYVFSAKFSDSAVVGIWLHSEFGSFETAQEYADKVTGPIGKLPAMMRGRLSHVVIHQGNETAFAEDLGRFFVLYSQNMDIRIQNNDLEETVFHEAVHATLDVDYASSAAWLRAQLNDGNYMTQYGRDNPDKEDLAESALFAYTMLFYPGRLTAELESWVRAYTPNRLRFFGELFSVSD